MFAYLIYSKLTQTCTLHKHTYCTHNTDHLCAKRMCCNMLGKTLTMVVYNALINGMTLRWIIVQVTPAVEHNIYILQ